MVKIVNFIYSDNIQLGNGIWKLNTIVLELNDYVELIGCGEVLAEWKSAYKSKRICWGMTKYCINFFLLNSALWKKRNIKSLEKRLNYLDQISNHLNANSLEIHVDDLLIQTDNY